MSCIKIAEEPRNGPICCAECVTSPERRIPTLDWDCLNVRGERYLLISVNYQQRASPEVQYL